MKKKIFFVCLFLFTIFSAFPNTDEEHTVLIYFYDTDIPRVCEYIFYEEGLIKVLKIYDLHKNIDIYNWETQKKDAVLIKSYEIENTDMFLIVNCVENGIKTKYKTINKKECLLEKGRLKKKLEGIQYWVLDDNLIKVRFTYEQPVLEKHNFKVSFDNKNVYTIEVPIEKHGDMWYETDIVYVSDYIPFSEETAILNSHIPSYGYCDFFYFEPVLQKARYDYKNAESSFSFTKTAVNISSPKGNVSLKNISIEDINGMSYVFLEGKKQGLLLKNSDFSVYYRENDETPFFMGWSSSQNRKIVEQTEIKSSTFLKEGKVSYVAENVKELKLKAPWAEGAEGNGEGEYIQFNKAEADGMYIVNGYVSMDRPDLYEKNGRVKEFTVTGLKSGIVQEEYILDSAKPQYVSLKAFENEPVRITVKSVYSGTKYEDTCISGIVLVKEN